MPPEKLSPKQLRAIWAAARARDIDPHDVAEAQAGKTSLRALTRDEAHRVLDVLNGKDPAAETAKRARFSNRAKRRRSPQRAQSTPAEANGNGNGKISRPASQEQHRLVMDLARQVGLTSGVSQTGYEADSTQLSAWSEKKFGFRLRTQMRKAGDFRPTYTGAHGRKVIYALRKWANWRLRRWEKAFDRETANAVLEIGLPKRLDSWADPENPRMPDEVVAKLVKKDEREAT